MVRTYLVTVRFRRACGPPRERAFVIEFLRPAGEWAAPGWRAAVALVLTLVRNQRRARQPHPGRPAFLLGQPSLLAVIAGSLTSRSSNSGGWISHY